MVDCGPGGQIFSCRDAAFVAHGTRPSVRFDVVFSDKASDIAEALRHPPEAELYFRGIPLPLSTEVSVDAADAAVVDAGDVVVCTLKSEYSFVLRLFKIATPCRTESAAGRLFLFFDALERVRQLTDGQLSSDFISVGVARLPAQTSAK